MGRKSPPNSLALAVTAGAALLLAAALGAGTAAPAHAAPGVDYARDVRPILAEHCYRCHGPEKQTHQLRLDQRAYAVRGGDSGDPAVKPGEPDASELIARVTHADPKQRMPRDADPLSAEQIATLRAWIAAGAPMPGDDTLELKLTTDHWSFQPIADPAPPAVSAPVANAIDAFVIAALDAKGLSLAAEADRRTLIRRVYLVMHGLLPTPAEVDAFVADTSADAYEKLIDRVLASPRYGERWGQHWLDVVRYGDTNGFETNTPRPNAWHYRDWVIAALNADKPYDRFLYEQIAGDQAGADVATGYLVAGVYDQVKSPDVNLTAMQRQDELHDIVSTTGAAMLGITVGCARCHNHKFDPVSQADYYAFQSVFSGVNHGDRTIEPSDQQRRERERRVAPIDRRLAEIERRIDALGGRDAAINTRRNVERFAAVEASAVRFTIFATNSGSQPCLDELEAWTAAEAGEAENVALASAGARASASDLLPGYPIHQIEHLNDGRYGNGRSWISNTAGGGWAMVEFAAPARIDHVVWGRDREGTFVDRVAASYVIEVRDGSGEWVAVASSPDREPGRWAGEHDEAARGAVAALAAEADRLTAERNRLQPSEVAYAGVFRQPPVTRRLYRGDPFAPREVVPPGVLSVIGSLDLAADAPEHERRVAFAEWVIAPENPLTARVMVNRIWQHHFGTGLVDTPSDFGRNGTPPTHPELLDWLARRFVESGWSIKHVHRLILASRTFRQSSAPNAEAERIDREARLLWRYPPRRLEAEPIRDSMLHVAGALDLTAGGPGWSFFEPNSNYVRNYEPKSRWGPAEFRRMVYAAKIRMEGGPVFGAFDCPDAAQPQPRRSRSTTAIQALNLFNSTFTMTLADMLAARIRTEAGDDPEAQIDRAYLLVLGRTPTDAERAIVRPLVAEHGLPALTRVLYNTNEFLFIP